jgi:hypothetical protein
METSENMKNKIMNLYIKNLNPKKILSIIPIVILLLISIFLIDSTNNPIKYTSGIAKEVGLKQIITKRDFISPTITILFADNPCPSERPEIKEFEYLISHPARLWSGLYISKDNILGLTRCEYLSEFLEIVKTKDLSADSENPDSSKFRNTKIKTKKPSNWFEQTEDEKYYNPIDTENEAPKSVLEYKKLKIGMSWESVKSITGNCDMTIGKGVTLQKTEIICVVKKNGINFVALGWESDPDTYKKNQKLINAWIVYDDRRAEELKLETVR